MLNDRDRYVEKEKLCVNHKELEDFIRDKFSKLKYKKQENLDYLTSQNDKCI